jgi:hypothetical protein
MRFSLHQEKCLGFLNLAIEIPPNQTSSANRIPKNYNYSRPFRVEGVRNSAPVIRNIPRVSHMELKPR